jgi:hypothetical protein
MFKNCILLTSAPDLLAETLADSCYACMFAGCIKLSKIEVGFKKWEIQDNSLISSSSSSLINSATWNWLYGVASTGTFVAFNLNHLVGTLR